MTKLRNLHNFQYVSLFRKLLITWHCNCVSFDINHNKLTLNSKNVIPHFMATTKGAESKFVTARYIINGVVPRSNARIIKLTAICPLVSTASSLLSLLISEALLLRYLFYINILKKINLELSFNVENSKLQGIKGNNYIL